MGPLVARLERVLPDLPVEIIFVDDSDDEHAGRDPQHRLVARRLPDPPPPARIAPAAWGAPWWRASGLHARRSCASWTPTSSTRRSCSRRCTCEAMETGSDLVVAQPLLPRRRQGHVQPPALGALAPVDARRGAAVPDAPVARERPDERMLHRAARAPWTSTACARAASRSCSRSWSGRPACACPRSRSGSASETPVTRRPRRARRSGTCASSAAWSWASSPPGSGASPSWARPGLVVNTLLLALFAEVIGIFYVLAAILATQGSTLWNFCLTEAWVFARPRPQAAAVGGGRRCSSP